MRSSHVRRDDLAFAGSCIAGDLPGLDRDPLGEPCVQAQDVLGSLAQLIGLVTVGCSNLAGKGAPREGPDMDVRLT